MNPCSEEEYYYKLDNMVLSSCQHLRKIFRLRWKRETGEEWVDHTDNAKKFMEGPGKIAYKKAPKFQKIAMENTSVEEWDISLLSLIIQKFGCEVTYKQENSAVQELKNLRNELAHHSTKKIPSEEFNKMAMIFRSSLKSLSMGDKEIEELINRTGISSSLQARKLMKTMHEKAEQFFMDGHTDKAIEFLSEAINIPSLLPENLKTAYEKRAEYFLKLVKNLLTDQDKCNQAFLDAKKALELNDSSWMAHYLTAKSYNLQNNFTQAIHHYERAISISPVQMQVWTAFDSCKMLAGESLGAALLEPNLLPMSLEEWLDESENRTGVRLSEEEYISNKATTEGQLWAGQDHTLRGHQHYFGLQLPQNFTEAFKCYSKATKLKNAEGLYAVVRCYIYGHGVKQDIPKALILCRELAEMDKNWPGHQTPLKCNVSVAAAQHALGLWYASGTGLEKDFAASEMWYKRAMENGMGLSAFNLGVLYIRGDVVPKDEKMMELCMKQALHLNTVRATEILMQYYIDNKESKKAMHMFRIGRDMGNSALLSMSEEEFKEELDVVDSIRLELEPEILEFEKSHKLTIKGVTFKERLIRYKNPAAVKLETSVHKSLTGYTGQPESWGGKFQGIDPNIIAIITEKASNGSETATSVLTTLFGRSELQNLLDKQEGVKCKRDGFDLLCSTVTIPKNVTNELTTFVAQIAEAKLLECDENRKWKILNLLYHCVTLEHYIVTTLPGNSKFKLRTIITELFQEHCQKQGDKDMIIRFCFAMLNFDGSFTSNDMFVVELLKEGVCRYPDNVHYYHLLVNVLEGKQEFKESKFYAEEALKKFPAHVGLLYNRACLLSKGLPFPSIAERIDAYKKFIHFAPKDHRKFPEGFYGISSLYLQQNWLGMFLPSSTSQGSAIKLVKSYFEQGLKAEKNQLPCYLPYGESGVKTFVKSCLNVMENPYNNNQNPSKQSILSRKEYLKSPTRKGFTLLHRKLFNATPNERIERRFFVKGTWPAKLKQTATKKMSFVKPITIMEMNPSQDRVYEDRILEVTIMDDPNLFFPALNLIAEDDNGDMIKLLIYNVGRDKGTVDNFRAGCRIAIINPYLRFATIDHTVGIRNDDPRCIVYLKKVENMCRFCGEENATFKCSKCKRPYCSRECQKLDWKEFKHKLMCSLKY